MRIWCSSPYAGITSYFDFVTPYFWHTPKSFVRKTLDANHDLIKSLAQRGSAASRLLFLGHLRQLFLQVLQGWGLDACPNLSAIAGSRSLGCQCPMSTVQLSNLWGPLSRAINKNHGLKRPRNYNELLCGLRPHEVSPTSVPSTAPRLSSYVGFPRFIINDWCTSLMWW